MRSPGSLITALLLAASAVICCAGPFLVAAIAGGTLPLIAAAHQTLLASIGAISAVLLWAVLAARHNGRDLGIVIGDALGMAFAPRARLRSGLLLLLIGVPLTFFYLVALPAERFGALAWGALQFLTPGDALAAMLIGLGAAASFAFNLAAQTARAAQTSFTLGGAIAALLPSSLCCTTLIPSALAALGASAPAIMHTSGRFQGFFARYSAEFIGFAVAAVLYSLWVAANNLAGGCTTCPISAKESS
jgi:hypothetical protein